VIVVETMQSSSTNEVQLLVGQAGTIIRIDVDGDAVIDFEDHSLSQWVSEANLPKLSPTKAGHDYLATAAPGTAASKGDFGLSDFIHNELEPVVSFGMPPLQSDLVQRAQSTVAAQGWMPSIAPACRVLDLARGYADLALDGKSVIKSDKHVLGAYIMEPPQCSTSLWLWVTRAGDLKDNL
jgi:hypothetical protein